MKINASTRLTAAALPEAIRSMHPSDRRNLAIDCSWQGIDLNDPSNVWIRVTDPNKPLKLLKENPTDSIIICIFNEGNELTTPRSFYSANYCCVIPEKGSLSIGKYAVLVGDTPKHIKTILPRSYRQLFLRADYVFFCKGKAEVDHGFVQKIQRDRRYKRYALEDAQEKYDMSPTVDMLVRTKGVNTRDF